MFKNRYFRESLLGFLFRIVYMTGVVCFILDCRTDVSDSLQQFKKCKDGRALELTCVTSYLEIRGIRYEKLHPNVSSYIRCTIL